MLKQLVQSTLFNHCTLSNKLLEISNVSTVLKTDKSSGKVFNRLPCKINFIDAL